ncbi:hypothetical protein FGO68_gene17524 [Halteria grandinella]|uniref:Uncharacterized protein n=1 Tax=Halteria grandinella TaxID=5974 RepID=A0A8J8P2N4_HALGN|nr:hypothetical protein FGO68_gene17524 [Halteria grandinella]
MLRYVWLPLRVKQLHGCCNAGESSFIARHKPFHVLQFLLSFFNEKVRYLFLVLVETQINELSLWCEMAEPAVLVAELFVVYGNTNYISFKLFW